MHAPLGILPGRGIMAPTLRPSHLHGRVCGQNLSVSIQNHDRRAHRQNVEYSANSSRVKGAGRALHRSVLAELLVCRALAAAEPIVGSWAQGLQRGSAKYEHVVQSFAEVLQERLVPVLLHNVLAAWLSMVVSGVAALQLPIRYAVTSSSAVLDCMFLVPLIPLTDGSPGAHKVAKLAALQVRLFQLMCIK